jgi:hypothetical protein
VRNRDDGTGSQSHPMTDFGISDVEPADSATTAAGNEVPIISIMFFFYTGEQWGVCVGCYACGLSELSHKL